MSVPKNYITSGINKNLLTPCRRIGLSRSKKTPKNASPLIKNPNIADTTIPVKIVEVDCDVNKNKNLDETPKKISTPKESKKNINCIEDNDESVANKVLKMDACSHKIKTILDKDLIQSEQTTILKSKNISILKKSLSQNVGVKAVVTAEVHHPMAKRNINFNKVEESSNRSTTKEQTTEDVQNSSVVTPRLEKKEEDELSTTISIKNQKRKLRLDSDDFCSDENQAEPESSVETSLTLRSTTIKKSRTTLNETSNGITLGRFTTEDYLHEYSNNPEIFQENLEESGLVNSYIKDHEDLDAFCAGGHNQMKSKEKNNRSPHQSKKKYDAIVCPIVKSKHSLSTKKSTMELKRLSEKITLSELNQKNKLIVSLERLTKDNLKSELKNDDNDVQLEDLPCTPESIISKTTHLKINPYDEDDEHFTSSPQNDKKQHKNLLQLVLQTENEIKQKEEKWEKLKRAQVYKKKHSPEKLKVSSNRWLEGCKAGLKDLLLKMQEHGPMEMETLVKKLRIPNDIVDKLKL